MQVVAHRQGDSGVLLVAETGQRGFVALVRQQRRGPSQDIQSILSRGYWEEGSGSLPPSRVEEMAQWPLRSGE